MVFFLGFSRIVGPVFLGFMVLSYDALLGVHGSSAKAFFCVFGGFRKLFCVFFFKWFLWCFRLLGCDKVEYF